MEVIVIERQENNSTYNFTVPGYSSGTSNATVSCNTYSNTTSCTGYGQQTGVVYPGHTGSYQVSGATLALKLPDGRIVVANCDAKLNWSEWSNPNMYRDCRVPIVDKIQAEFNGEKAKLTWPVSIDGKKLKSETYKILGILPAAKEEPKNSERVNQEPTTKSDDSNQKNLEPENEPIEK
jgi:hypothetical protein